MRGYPHFSVWIPLILAKNYLFPVVITFAKIHLYQEAPSLKGHLSQAKADSFCSITVAYFDYSTLFVISFILSLHQTIQLARHSVYVQLNKWDMDK